MPTQRSQPEVEDRIKAARQIALFLDFDGTLTPIVSHPEQAHLDDSVRETIGRVSRHADIVTTVIGGRALDDLRARIGLAGLIYAGNHGLEIDAGTLRFVEPAAAAARDELRRVTDRLAADVKVFDGVFVHYKGLTASVHYRDAAQGDVPLVERLLKETVQRAASRFRIAAGKKTWEILPGTDWDKGSAVRWILNRACGKESLCIYLGDDRTDEEAFRALPGAITIKVGRGGWTRANYRLPDPAAVHEFLRWLETHKQPLEARGAAQ